MMCDQTTSIRDILKLLGSDSSRNFKLDVLQQQRDNKLLQRVICLALNPMIQFYIRKIPKYTINDSNSDDKLIPLDQALDKLNQLTFRRVTGNAAIEFLRSVLESVSADDQYVIERVIEKDLRCNAAVATVNRVWNNLIPEYPVMLCDQVSDKLVAKFNWPAFVQLKEDGMRFNCIKRRGELELFTRNGKTIELPADCKLIRELKALPDNYVYDGELLAGGADRKTGNGIINRAVKQQKLISVAQADTITATLWDMIPIEHFENLVSNISYNDRFNQLTLAIGTAVSQNISVVETMLVDDYPDALELFTQVTADGHEGIIIKDRNAKWEPKRSKQMLKVKSELDCDLEIVELVEGTGKNAQSLGAMICKSSDDLLRVGVGTGFTDAQRKQLWSNRETLVGKICKVKYNAKIDNKQGGLSLFLPVFVETRLDKDKANRSTEIL